MRHLLVIVLFSFTFPALCKGGSFTCQPGGMCLGILPTDKSAPAVESPAFEIADEITAAIRAGNAKELSKYFADNVDLRILEKENVYSKAQAELIIKDFFSKNTVKSFSTVHKSVPKGGTQYFIGTLETSGGKFRTYILIKKTGDKQLIQQFRIESENE